MRRCWIAVVVLAACPSSGRKAPPREQPAYVGADKPIDASILRWTDETERARFERVRACYAERGASWEHFPLREIGNFVQEDWCRGARVPSGCSSGDFHDQPDVDWATVATLYYPPDWPEVFSSIVYAGHRPPEGWGAWIGISTNGKTILGDGGAVGFGRTGDEDSDLYAGTATVWEVGNRSYEVAAEGDGWQLLDRVRASPAALRDETIASWTALEAKVIAALDAGEGTRCEYGKSEDGLPPPCVEVALTAAEIDAERARIRDKVAAIRATFETEGDALHALLLQVAPPGCP